MSRTKRKLPTWGSWLRYPQYKWKLLAGIGRKKIVTEYDDKNVAAFNEVPAKKQKELM
jgi:hypothetical protein